MRVLIAFFLAFVAIGCAPVDNDNETTAASEPDPDKVFLTTVYGEFPELEDTLSDQDLINMASAVCDLFDSGGSVSDLSNILADNQASSEQVEVIGFVSGAGVSAYCPEHRDKF